MLTFICAQTLVLYSSMVISLEFRWLQVPLCSITPSLLGPALQIHGVSVFSESGIFMVLFENPLFFIEIRFSILALFRWIQDILGISISIWHTKSINFSRLVYFLTAVLIRFDIILVLILDCLLFQL